MSKDSGVSSLRRARVTPARLAALALTVGALTLALGAATANASLLSPVKTFGSPGSGAGQLSSPVGVAIQPTSGNVYVADSGNARVDEFGPGGNFIAAFGWGVGDGNPQAEVCTSSCQAGIPGSGPGQFSNPRSIAFGVQGGASAGKVFVGDAGNNVVEVFDAGGGFVSTIDGTGTPQGHFQSLAGVAVDQGGNLWTADGATGNIDEFSASGAFVRQWTDTRGFPGAIAVDSNNNSVYLIDNPTGFIFDPGTERWTLTGQWTGEIDREIGTTSFTSFGSALALDPRSGDLYVDHTHSSGGDVAVYDHNGVQLDDVSLASTANSQGLAFRSSGPGNPTGKQNLYVTDTSASNVTIEGPQSTPGAPLVTFEPAPQTGKTTATLAAGIVPLGHDTTCKIQYVDNADFQASGYTNATTVACTPADLGSSFTYQTATAGVSGLTLGSYYHFRVIVTNSAGTTTGADQEFQVGPGAWAPFSRCPVDDPAMLATSQVFLGDGCVASNSTHGSITLGNITTATANTNLQFGVAQDPTTGATSLVPPGGGALVVDPVQLNTPVGPVTAVTESAGTPSNFCLFCGLETGAPIITVPIKIQLENNPTLGPSCFIGSDQNPILLNPENTDLSNLVAVSGGFFSFDPNGAPDLAGLDASLQLTGIVQGDDTFAVPGATGCGANGALDAAVNAVAGLPSPSGSNHLVLDDASSALAGGFGGEQSAIRTGQQFANDWHTAFG